MRFKTLAAIAVLCFSTSAAAEVPPLEPLNYSLRYDVTWNHIRIGRIFVKVNEDSYGYRMSVDTKTSGIARLFNKEKSLALIEGKRVDGAYVPVTYTSRNDGDSKQRTEITYDGEGHIATYTRTPPNTDKTRQPVVREDANSATDPVTLFFALRKSLHAAMKVNVRDVSARSYDGLRLGQISLHVASPARVEVLGGYQNAINTVITRKPINGYSAKELKKFAEGDPTIHIFFSADGALMPLKAQLQAGFGTIAATLVEMRETKAP